MTDTSYHRCNVLVTKYVGNKRHRCWNDKGLELIDGKWHCRTHRAAMRNGSKLRYSNAVDVVSGGYAPRICRKTSY